MAFWRRREPVLDTSLPRQWPTRRGPQVEVEVAGTGYYQGILARLRRQVPPGAWLPVLAYPEPDNRHDENAVALLAAGHRVGYLPRAYAALWQPVVLYEHQRGRIVAGTAQLIDGPGDSIGVRAWLTQPAPTPDWPLPPQQQVPSGSGQSGDVWAARTLTSALRREHRRALRRLQEDALTRIREQEAASWRVRSRRLVSAHDRFLAALAQARTASSPFLWRQELSATEALLWHYLAQWPDPFVVTAQVPVGYRRVDFLCEHAMLVIEVDGPEHDRQQDQRRDAQLATLGLRTVRVRNADVQADPAGVAADLFTHACRLSGALDPSHPASPYRNWAARDRLRPGPSPRPVSAGRSSRKPGQENRSRPQ